MADAGRWVVTVGAKPERDLAPGAVEKFRALFPRVVGTFGSWVYAKRRWGK